MSGSITLYTRNILESGTVTVTGDPDAGYPESRLHDRHISLYWKFTGTQATNFVIDQGASGNVAVDFLAIESHNFNLEDIQWQYSTTGAWAGEEVDAVTDWTQDGNGQIIKVMVAAQTKRYWRITLTSMVNPQCSEIFMSYGQEFDIMQSPGPDAHFESNVSWRRTQGGLERSTKFGDARKVRRYNLFLENAGDLLTLRTAIDDLDEFSKPFYLKDHEGYYWLARFTGAPEVPEKWDHKTHSHIDIELIEML